MTTSSALMPDLVGRDRECREIDELIERARDGHGGALLLQGEAGIGKTALLGYARRRASGMTVLAAGGIETESEIPYSGLSELLRPLVGRLSVLPDRQAAALAGALALGPPVDGDPFAVAAATLSLIASAAAEGAVLVMVDDLPWLDTSSSEAVLFAARRLEAEPVALLFAARSPGSNGGSGGNGGSWPGIAVRVIGGLDRDSSIALLAAQFADPVPGDVAERLFIETGGNPLALIEIPRQLPGGLADAEALGREPLPLSERLELAYARLVASLPDGARGALLVAAANDATDVDTVLGALREVGLGVGDLEAAEAAGLITSDGLQVRFRHPLVRSSVYYGADPARRREAHRALARALERDAVECLVRRAWHLASATLGHDEGVASLLEAAADSARRRSGLAAAARAYERAGRVSPDVEARARRLFAAAEAAWQLANHYEHAVALLDEAAQLTADRMLAADIEHLRGRINTWRGPGLEAWQRLRTCAEELCEVAPERAAMMMTDAAPAAIGAGDLRRALVTAERAHELAVPVGGSVELVAALQLGKARILTGDVPNGYPLIMRAVAELEREGAAQHDALVQCAPALLAIEEYELVERLLHTVITAQRAANAAGLLAYSLGAQAELEVRTGRWAQAAANGSEAVQLAGESGQVGQLSYDLARLARLEATQGHDEVCRADVARAIRLAEQYAFDSTLPFGESALGLLELGRGRLPDAIRHLEETARLWSREGFAEPGRLPWQADLAEAYARSGLLDEAERVLAELERQAGACRRPGRDGRPDTACTLAHAAASRCRALLPGSGDPEGHFEAALAWHAWTSTPFEQARTRLCYGEHLRRRDRRSDARPHLRAALEAFERLGAEPWSDRARAELAATGETVRGRSRPIEELTPQELQVALLVASGATNREAGASLFLTPKTIEFHLAKVYRKLDLRSRTELAGWVARQQPARPA